MYVDKIRQNVSFCNVSYKNKQFTEQEWEIVKIIL